MTTIVTLKNFIAQNKDEIYETAYKNTKLNNEGKPTISQADDWFKENEWNEYLKK